MKVLAPRRHPQALIELIHQPGLATPHRPPEVNPGDRCFGALVQRRMACLQRLDRLALRIVSHKTIGQGLLVGGQG